MISAERTRKCARRADDSSGRGPGSRGCKDGSTAESARYCAERERNRFDAGRSLRQFVSNQFARGQQGERPIHTARADQVQPGAAKLSRLTTGNSAEKP